MFITACTLSLCFKSNGKGELHLGQTIFDIGLLFFLVLRFNALHQI